MLEIIKIFVMKKKVFAVIFVGLSLVGIGQNVILDIPYYYYYKGEKQYLELDTRTVFVSVSEHDTASTVVANRLKQNVLRADIPASVQTRTQHKRFWAELTMEDSLSEKAYLAKLSELKNSGTDIIAAPYFKNGHQDKIGLSNFFYVKLKSLSDTVLLKQYAEKEQAVIMWQNEFMPLRWYEVLPRAVYFSRFNLSI